MTKKTVIWFIWFVLFIWLNETNQMNQTNQMTKQTSFIRQCCPQQSLYRSSGMFFIF